MKSPVLLARDYFVRCCCCCCCFFSNVGVLRCLLMDSSVLLYANIPKHISFEFLDDVTMCCLYTIALYIFIGQVLSVCFIHLLQRKSEAAELDAAEERLVLGGEAWGRETKFGFLFTDVETWNASFSTNFIGILSWQSVWIWKKADRWVLSFEQMHLPSRELTYPPKMAFWRWFSFSQGGICQFPGGYLFFVVLFRAISTRRGMHCGCFRYGRNSRWPWPQDLGLAAWLGIQIDVAHFFTNPIWPNNIQQWYDMIINEVQNIHNISQSKKGSL